MRLRIRGDGLEGVGVTLYPEGLHVESGIMQGLTLTPRTVERGGHFWGLVCVTPTHVEVGVAEAPGAGAGRRATR